MRCNSHEDRLRTVMSLVAYNVVPAPLIAVPTPLIAVSFAQNPVPDGVIVAVNVVPNFR